MLDLLIFFRKYLPYPLTGFSPIQQILQFFKYNQIKRKVSMVGNQSNYYLTKIYTNIKV